MNDAALVIGSGPNGLAAAIRLAQAGKSVLVLEAASHAGGAVRTEELTLPGFRHDVFSSVYPAGAASPVFARMDLQRYGLEWVHPAACSAHPLPGARAIALYRDLEATAASIDRVQPGNGIAWREFACPLLERFDAIRSMMLSGFPPLHGAMKLAARGPLQALRFATLLPGTATHLGRRLFAGEDARAWLYGAAAHGDVPPGGSGSAIAVTYLNLLGHAVGWPSPRGGAQALSDALVAHLRELGGEVRCDARVTEIHAEKGRVSGITIEGGERLAGSIVVADVMPHALVAMAAEALPSAYCALMRRYRYGPATVKVDWALDGPIPWQAGEAREAGTIHLGGGEQQLLSSIAAAQGGCPGRPFLLLGQQSIADPSRAPAGKHTAWAYTHGPRGLDWARETPRWVERMEEHIELYAPGFTELILARHVLSPAGLQARNANLVGGDVGGGSYRLDQMIFRPLPAPSPYLTPIRGLAIGSAATFPGGAVHGVPGDAAARAVLSRMSRGRRVVRRGG